MSTYMYHQTPPHVVIRRVTYQLYFSYTACSWASLLRAAQRTSEGPGLRRRRREAARAERAARVHELHTPQLASSFQARAVPGPLSDGRTCRSGPRPVARAAPRGTGAASHEWQPLAACCGAHVLRHQIQHASRRVQLGRNFQCLGTSYAVARASRLVLRWDCDASCRASTSCSSNTSRV